jgi:trehalose 6-phosphate phosphatase
MSAGDAHRLGSEAGRAALAALMCGAPARGVGGAPTTPPLVGFDFDGTLAPIVARPHDARIPLPVLRRLRALAARVPVAVVSGRAVADVRARLGFEPWALVGNHGAELGAGAVTAVTAAAGAPIAAALDGVRRALHAEHGALREAGVMVEDKGLSIALHYRLARDRAAALALVHRLLAAAGPGFDVQGGKMVANVLPRGAPDKADAMRDLARRCGAERVFFAGDDENDEPVFRSAPREWLTVRVGRDGPPHTAARFRLDAPGELTWVLDEMLRLGG